MGIFVGIVDFLPRRRFIYFAYSFCFTSSRRYLLESRKFNDFLDFNERGADNKSKDFCTLHEQIAAAGEKIRVFLTSQYVPQYRDEDHE